MYIYVYNIRSIHSLPLPFHPSTNLTGYLVIFLPDSAASLSVLTDNTASTASFAKNSDSGPCVCILD